MIGALTYLASAAELRPLYNGPSALVRAKQIDRIDGHCRSFIARSPLVMIGSSHPERGADVSPRGDAPGFVQMLDEHHLAIPDRPGNNRLDTLENLLASPAVGLFFLVPGVEETLRVNGTARLSRTQPLLDIMAVDGMVPKLAIVVTVTEAFLHYAKALRRARLWADDYRIDRKQLPTLGRMIVEQARPVGLTAEEADARIEADYRTNLY
jgi:PPOX class probable FMN-dependent enzyme